MKGQETEQKITIKAAAQILGVSPKTIQRYLAKGRLTRVKEGTRTLLLLAEVKALERDYSLGQGRPSPVAVKGPGTGQTGDTVTLSRERYEQFLLELGELRKQNQFYLEFKGILLAKEESIQRLERGIEQLQERVLALELKRTRGHPSAVEGDQADANNRGQGKTKPKKPWWQA